MINRPVMNCSMNIFLYFYFSNNILFDFPSSGLIYKNNMINQFLKLVYLRKNNSQYNYIYKNNMIVIYFKAVIISY